MAEFMQGTVSRTKRRRKQPEPKPAEPEPDRDADSRSAMTRGDAELAALAAQLPHMPRSQWPADVLEYDALTASTSRRRQRSMPPCSRPSPPALSTRSRCPRCATGARITALSALCVRAQLDLARRYGLSELQRSACQPWLVNLQLCDDAHVRVLTDCATAKRS